MLLSCVFDFVQNVLGTVLLLWFFLFNCLCKGYSIDCNESLIMNLLFLVCIVNSLYQTFH